eukprot:2034336-Prymnesium_polylepis.1
MGEEVGLLSALIQVGCKVVRDVPWGKLMQIFEERSCLSAFQLPCTPEAQTVNWQWMHRPPGAIVTLAAICVLFVLGKKRKGIRKCSCSFEVCWKARASIQGSGSSVFPLVLSRFCIILALLLIPCAATTQAPITVSTGSHPNEVSWMLVCSGGSVLEGGAPFSGSSNATS